MKISTKRIALATLFGTLIFITKTIAPSPIDKMLIFIHALLLALGSLLLRGKGATYAALIGGILTALWRIALAPFTLLFAFLFGLFVDGFFFLFKVHINEDKVSTARLVASMTISAALVGLLSYYTSITFGLLPRDLILEVSILTGGTLSGAIAGYFAAHVWNKYLKNVKL